MATLKDQITDLQNELLVAKDEGKITPEGVKLLDQIQGGQWQTGGFGQFLKGMTMNFSDEGIGALKLRLLKTFELLCINYDYGSLQYCNLNEP
jgi:hypothetical protein